MHRWFRICALLALTVFVQTSFAEEPKEESKNMAAIRQLLEQQSKQIDALTQKVDHLSQIIEANRPAPMPTVSVSGSVTEPVAKAEPVPTTSGSASPSAATEAAASPSATPDPTLPTHTVKKGENLTSIAHRHGTTVTELLKLN
jgi:LysM repeat protein